MADSSSHVTEINIVMQNLTNDKHRLEGDLVMMKQQLDDALVVKRSAEERAERLAGEVTDRHCWSLSLSLSHSLSVSCHRRRRFCLCSRHTGYIQPMFGSLFLCEFLSHRPGRITSGVDLS